MDPTAIFDAAKLFTGAGATVYIAVELVKRFTGTAGRATLLTAVLAGFALTGLYAFSNGLLLSRYAFDLVVAAFAVVAAGVGINAAANTTAKG